MSKSLAKYEKMAHPALSFGPFLVTPVGLVVEHEPTWEEWQRLYDSLARIDDFSNWSIGDAEAYTRPKYGEAADQLTSKWSEHTYEVVRKSRWVAERVQFGSRDPNLTWGHHRVVAPLDTEAQLYWLKMAATKDWDRDELRAAIRLARLVPKNLNLNVKPELYHGDMMTVVPSLGQFDLIVTDPPYGVSANYDSTQELEWDAFDDFLAEAESWLAILRPALKPDFNLFWFCSPRWAADMEILFRRFDLPIQSRIVWARRSLPLGRSATGKFLSTWDMVLHSGNRDLNFPAEWGDQWFDVQNFEAPLTTHTGIDARVHETQKPSGLIERLVTFGSFPGDRVLDPFAGSGTVGAVCPTDRECILVEKEDAYCKAIEERLNVRRETRKR